MSEVVPSGPERSGVEVAALVRQAMGGVTASIGAPNTATTSLAASVEIARRLPALWDAMWQAAAGYEPVLVAPPPHARRLLDALRRSFVDLLRSSPDPQCVDVRDVVRILDAVERVQGAIDRDVAASVEGRLAGPGGMDLVTEVAHDLRSPLTSILYLAETLRAGQSGPVEPLQEHQLALIYTAAFELSSLANDLTELARGGEQLLERQPVPFSIDDLLRSVCDIVMPIAEEKGLALRVTRAADDRRLGQPAALGRVLLNLVTNALKYTSKGLVEVGAHDLGPSRTEFTVRDNGPGMPAEVVAQIFEPRAQERLVDERGFSSSGLGLAICRRLVAAMGGELRVKSAPERGSCFYFELPLPTAGPLPMLESARTG
jgi:signal transduction histidine kinase